MIMTGAVLEIGDFIFHFSDDDNTIPTVGEIINFEPDRSYLREYSIIYHEFNTDIYCFIARPIQVQKISLEEAMWRILES